MPLLDYDLVYIGVLTYYLEVMQILKSMGIPRSKIIDKYVSVPIFSRINFLENYYCMCKENNLFGAVAEVGVYRGDFAKEINRVFKHSKIYLFDTFDGFVEQDCIVENNKNNLNKVKEGYFSNTSEQTVLDKMLYKENCEIVKGYFPKSAIGIEDDFIFVNLDVDLYAPTLSGLQFFYPKMKTGGIILVHDYFSKAFLGVKQAVVKFCSENNIKYFPIGDTLSVGIIKE